MKIKEGFVLQEIAGSNVVVPVGEVSAILNGIISLNDSGVLLWNLLTEGAEQEQLVNALVAEYGIPNNKALRDVNAFLDTLRSTGCLEK